MTDDNQKQFNRDRIEYAVNEARLEHLRRELRIMDRNLFWGGLVIELVFLAGALEIVGVL